MNAQNLNFFFGNGVYIALLGEERSFQNLSFSHSRLICYDEGTRFNREISVRMYGSRGINTIPRHLISVAIILGCFTGVLLAQTFQYSRGWTNGRKRSPMMFVMDDKNEDLESFGICQMQILKHILEHKHHGEVYLPCEILERPEEDLNRLKGSFETSSVADTLPALKNQGIRKIEVI